MASAGLFAAACLSASSDGLAAQLFESALRRPWVAAADTSVHSSLAGRLGQARAMLYQGVLNLLVADSVCLPDGDRESLFAALDAAPRSAAMQAVPRVAPGAAAFQLVNHFANSDVLLNKAGLVRSLNRSLAGSATHVFDITPTTYFVSGGLRSEAESPVLAQFVRRFSAVATGHTAEMRMPAKQCAGNLWVVKPAAAGSASQLAVCSSLAEVKTYISHVRGDFVIQKCECVAAGVRWGVRAEIWRGSLELC